MASGTPVSYSVTGVTQETKYNINGTPIPGKNVTFTTSTNYQGTIFIPDTVFGDLTAMRQAIDGEVKAVANAMMITGTIGGLSCG